MGIEFFNNKDKERKQEERMHEIATKAKDEAIVIGKNDLKAFADDNLAYRKKTDEDISFLLKKIEMLEKAFIVTKGDLAGIETDKDNDNADETFDKYLNCENLCRKLKIKGLSTSAQFKFYLFEKGLMEMSINEVHNSFKPSTDLDKNGSELKEYILVKKGNVPFFNEDIIPVLRKKEQEILESVNRYNLKITQYKKSKKELENRNAENYRAEILKICGTESAERWYLIYKEFAKRFPTFWKDFNKYKQEHPKTGMYDTTKIHYVVSVMGQGNYLLKIACDLFVE